MWVQNLVGRLLINKENIFCSTRNFLGFVQALECLFMLFEHALISLVVESIKIVIILSLLALNKYYVDNLY